MSNGLGRPTFRRRGFGAALTVLVAAFALQTAGAAHAQSDPVAEFYKGKTVTILVGYEGGGGYDIYARIVAQFLGKHIPGNPAVIVQNMPGAGGLRAARNLATVSAKDGTALGMLAQTLPFDTLLGYTPDIDAARFNWIGRAAMNVEVGVAIAKTGVTSVEDARKREVPTAGTGGTASSTVVPFLLNQLAGTRFKLIAGYKSANEALVTMERGEVDAVGAIGLAGEGRHLPAHLPERADAASRHPERADHRRARRRQERARDPRPVRLRRGDRPRADLATRRTTRARRRAAPCARRDACRPRADCIREEGQPSNGARHGRRTRAHRQAGAFDAETDCG
jgi:hypothetical protein